MILDLDNPGSDTCNEGFWDLSLWILRLRERRQRRSDYLSAETENDPFGQR